MILELVFGIYAVLFCLGFYTDYQLSMKSKDINWLLALPLTAPIIGFLTLKDLYKLYKLKKLNKTLNKIKKKE